MNRLLLLITIVALSSCATPPPYKPVGDARVTMALVLAPAAEALWDAAGYIDTPEGSIDLQPTSEEGWLAVQHGAAVIIETGNLLMMPDRAIDDGAWRAFAQQLSGAGRKAMAAATVEDAQALFDAGADLYQVCTSCHAVYWNNDRFE